MSSKMGGCLISDGETCTCRLHCASYHTSRIELRSRKCGRRLTAILQTSEAVTLLSRKQPGDGSHLDQKSYHYQDTAI